MPDLDVLYSILRDWAANGEPQTYGDLSHAYAARTGEYHEPHGTWDRPLGEINERLAAIGAPALSALVILQGQNEPGEGFWASAPNVPARPANEVARITAWTEIVAAVLAYPWPEDLP